MTCTFSYAWHQLVDSLIRHGRQRRPRGQPTLELPHQTICFDARYPVLLNQARRLSYQFMAAEAYWILSGDDRVSTIAPYNEHITQFSDDGAHFFGAYGPRVVEQWSYVLNTLLNDPASRQAGMMLWRPSPPPSKDIPCTLAVWFHLDGEALDVHVFMRSSDVWLGLPYDAFTFSSLGWYLCGLLNSALSTHAIGPRDVYLTAVSSHLYERDLDKARTSVQQRWHEPDPSPVPRGLYLSTAALLAHLQALRETKRGDLLRWWEAR